MRHWVQEEREAITAVQIRTGHQDFDCGHFYFEEKNNSARSEDRDLETISKRGSGLAVNITTSALWLRCIVDLADFILEEARVIDQEGRANLLGAHLAPAAQDAQYELADSNNCLIQRSLGARRRAQGLLSEAEAWKHKAGILVQTMLSLTALPDQNISIRIAQDSRTLAEKATRDSTSMKAIAAVTMCFLPGTLWHRYSPCLWLIGTSRAAQSAGTSGFIRL